MPFRRAVVLALLVVAAGDPARAQEPGGAPGAAPAAQRLDNVLPRRCGVCHVDKAPPPATGLIAFSPPPRAGAGGAAMCYSCHNGIVRDDRRTLWTGRHHPAAGKVSCGSCHSPHVQAPDVGVFMRFPRGSYAFCASCHPGRRAGDAGEHPAVAGEKGGVRDCGGCHVAHRAQGDGLIRSGTAESLCGPCHGDNPSREGRGPGRATHVSGKSGPPCLSCHSVHRTAGGSGLLGSAALDGRLCRQCHERNFSTAAAGANHPVGAGGATCLSCHRMHNAEVSSARRGLLKAPWIEVDTICAACHADSAGVRPDGTGNHPLGSSVDVKQRPLAERLARAGAYFNPGARVSCLSCHRSHGAPAGTPQLATTRQALCLYCHPAQNTLAPDGAAPGSHPISVRPKRARVDASFVAAGGVVGGSGELTCATCHRAHRGSPDTPGLVLPRSRYSCLLCHRDEASVAETSHSSARSTLGARAAGGGLCGGCHGEHGWRIPVGEIPEGRTVIELICGSCHGDGLAAPGFSGATHHPLGYSPPAGRGTAGLPLFWRDGRRYRRGVVTCATCHDVHRTGAAGAFLREGYAAGDRDLCVGCHPAQAVVARTRHDARATGGSLCGGCHAVHDPGAADSWPAARRGGDRRGSAVAAVCGRCHGPRGPGESASAAGRLHPPSRAGGGADGVGCVGCHDPHRWNPDDPDDRGAPPAGSPDARFLVASPSALCAGCHPDQAAVVGTPHDLTRAPGGAGGPDVGVGRQDVCRPCHRAHDPAAPPDAGAAPAAAEPGSGPAAAVDPCERCHAPGKLAAAAVVGRTGHPVGVSAGQDVGPDLPLFGFQQRRQAGGRIGCGTCHDPHRWSPPGGSGGDSKAATSFLRMSADGYAPLCFPCHAEKSLVVGTDHDLRVTAPTAVNLQGETAEASGVCGACHTVHATSASGSRWNRELGEGRDQASRACTGCHRVGSGQVARLPPRTDTHLVNFPGRGSVSRLFTVTRKPGGGQTGIPVFDDEGLPSDKGYLTCASCHDVHRWEPDASSSGPGVPVEGDATNSFLRVPAAGLSGTLCAECHGDSLVERFRNYHFPEGR